MDQKTKKISKLTPARRRNDSLFDLWSVIHLLTGVFMGWLMDPFAALVIMVLWEPFEILLLSPFLARFNIVFGHESLRNSLSDIVFDVLGVVLGYILLREIANPPLYYFNLR